jgi:hypothetical protein
MKKSILGLALCAATLAPLAYGSAPPAISFTVTATSNTNDYGYTLDNSYTFVFTTGNSFNGIGSYNFNSTNNTWSQETVGDDRMWSTVGGTGLIGAYSDPQAPGSDTPYSFITTTNSNILSLYASNDSNLDIGLAMADNANPLKTT